MKKLLVLMIILLFAVPSFAAMTWTIRGSVDESEIWNTGQRVQRIKLYCLSDGSNPDSIDLSDYLTTAEMATIKGGQFVQLDTDPGTAPDAVWAVTISNDIGGAILTLSGLSVTATEFHNTGAEIGFHPIIYDLAIDLADIGSASDEVTLYFYIAK